MKNFKLLFPLSLMVILLLGFSSCSKEDLSPNTVETVEFRDRGNTSTNIGSGNTIVDIAIGNPDFSILVEAVVKADLVGVLSSDGPFTVFAPTNSAFVALLSDLDLSSLDDVPVDVLTTILTTHVLSGEFTSGDLSTGYFNTVANGPGNNPTDLFINTTSGVSINGSVNVIAADVDASNGVIHVIDKVIQPSDIVTLAASNPAFSSLVAALTRPDLSIDFIGALNSGGPFTVLAPTNEAFQNLLDSNPAWNSLNDIPAAVLEAVLSYHVTADGNITSSFFFRRPVVNTLLPGSTYTSAISFNGGLSLEIVAGSNTATVVAADVQAQNGVVHAIDTVILP
mgnify:FL=1